MKKTSVAGSISYVMVIMVFSRLLSLLSNQIYMSFFGASGQQINIYSYAVSVPNIIFNCFGTALSTVVIPIYAGHIAKGEKKDAKKFADNIITISCLFTLVLILIGMALSFVIPRWVEFGQTPEGYSYTTKALMIMMPVMLFYGLNYIFQGMLQSVGKFGWPAFVSVPSSLVVIGYVLLLGDRYGVDGLLIATFIGLALQALILIPPLISWGYRYKPSFDLRDRDVITAGKMTLNVLAGVSAYQLNMFYNLTMIARYEGMVTLLNYAQNITVYMVLAFVYSITAVIYPRLTAFAANDDMQSYKKTLTDITKTLIALLTPLTFGFIAVRYRLLDLIANWGKITGENIETAARFLMMYSIGIVAIGIKEVYDRAFYALKNTKLPAINGFVIMGVNIGLSLVFMQLIGAYGIPLAYSAATITGAAVLIIMLHKKIGFIDRGLIVFFLKSILASALMLFTVWGIDALSAGMFAGTSVLMRIMRLAVPSASGVVVYALFGAILKIDYITELLRKICRRDKR